jgi:hypothetical protein
MHYALSVCLRKHLTIEAIQKSSPAAVTSLSAYEPSAAAVLDVSLALQ